MIRIITNRVKNAIEAIKKKKVSAIKAIVSSAKENIKSIVSDNGKSIAEHRKDMIFEPMFSQNQVEWNLIYRKLKNIDGHKRSISFSTSENRETPFSVILPKT